MNLLHCLFAMAFAAITLALLSFVGARPKICACPAIPGYSRCAMLQDIRSVFSFLLGAVLCCVFARGKDSSVHAEVPQQPRKVQLYAYML